MRLGLGMLTERAIRAETPWAHQSRPNRGREPPWPPPSSIATVIASISGTPRSARERRTRMCPWPRRSCHRRRATAVAFLSPCATRWPTGPACQSCAGGRPTVGHAITRGRARIWAAAISRAGPIVDGSPLGFPNLFSFILFPKFVCRFKNVYLLIGRSKYCGSNFFEFLVVSSFY
jgi:hypothetical protein